MSRTAVVVIDMIKPYEHADADRLIDSVRTALPAIALDAHIRHLQVCVPADAVAHIHADLAEAALRMMELNLGADVCPAAKVSF